MLTASLFILTFVTESGKITTKSDLEEFEKMRPNRPEIFNGRSMCEECKVPRIARSSHCGSCNRSEIAVLCNCCERTIHRDFKHLGLHSFSQISDEHLLELIKFILDVTYNDIGRRFINAALLALGHRV